jgi:hypothetical protein
MGGSRFLHCKPTVAVRLAGHKILFWWPELKSKSTRLIASLIADWTARSKR